jgi:starvation-inducible outer membrane lipoprotein
MKIILSDIWPEIVLVIIIAVAMMMNGCSAVPHAIREQTWPLEMA